ncbi:MAG: methylenetetrahydrofolate reductase [NAD(P)H] [Spirochaetales bacterium]|nr:methylenetetrahydrofolate reductase [NAD(P)H] [Spirochaetales bacterium]
MTDRRVADLLTSGETIFSFEFFPPKTPKGWDTLFRTIGDDLLPLEPAYVSVTYGAGGSTRTQTHRLVTRIQAEFGLTVVAHLTCVGSMRDEIDAILAEYDSAGVCNILALRGDPPADPALRETMRDRLGPDGQGSPDFPYAVDLIAYIRRHYPHFSIGVAGFPEGHPETPNRLIELELLRRKIDAGADYIVTQLFFDNRDYFDYVDRLRLADITVPVVPGVMPVTSRAGMRRMAELAAGSRFPAPLLRAISRARDDDGVRRVGTHWATAQVAELLNAAVPGVHLYTLNNSHATITICESLGLDSYRLR